MTDPGTAAELAFLRRPTAHPEAPRQVTVVETHFAYVFLAGNVVRKIKKRVRTDHLDFTSLERRLAACRAEVHLNRELSPGVYLGVERLTRGADGRLRLDGAGEVVDAVVRMRRLPAARTLERCRVARTSELVPIADKLAAFYRAAAPGIDTAPARIDQVGEALARLAAAWVDGPAPRALAVLGTLQGFLATAGDVVGARAEAGAVIDGHGDLRPEHVYLTRPPQILDRIEFDGALRIVDWLEDLALLAVDLERARRHWLASWLARAIADRLDDAPPRRLWGFYRAWRAVLRARLCIEHRERPGSYPPAEWTRRANAYLEIAERHALRLT